MDLNAAVASMPFAAGLGIGNVVGDATGIAATVHWADAHTTLGGAATITVAPLHVGRTTAVVQTDIHRADGRLAVRTTQTQSLVRPG